MTVSQAFFVFHDTENLKGYWSVILWNVPQLDLSDALLLIRMELCFGEEDYRGKVPFVSYTSRIHIINVTYHCRC